MSVVFGKICQRHIHKVSDFMGLIQCHGLLEVSRDY